MAQPMMHAGPFFFKNIGILKPLAMRCCRKSMEIPKIPAFGIHHMFQGDLEGFHKVIVNM